MASTIAAKSRSAAPSTPVTRDPFTMMRDEMNELISRMWSGQENASNGLTLKPAMDISEDENAYEIRVDVPGMNAKDFDIQVQGNSVTVSGKRTEEKEEKDKTFHRVERRCGSFSRSVTLPCDVNEDEVAAHYENGVLMLSLPKSEKSRVKKISVKS